VCKKVACPVPFLWSMAPLSCGTSVGAWCVWLWCVRAWARRGWREERVRAAGSSRAMINTLFSRVVRLSPSCLGLLTTPPSPAPMPALTIRGLAQAPGLSSGRAARSPACPTLPARTGQQLLQPRPTHGRVAPRSLSALSSTTPRLLSGDDGSNGDADPELWAVLDLCDDGELEAVHGILYGERNLRRIPPPRFCAPSLVFPPFSNLPSSSLTHLKITRHLPPLPDRQVPGRRQ